MNHLEPAVVALGMFDGVHIGHQELLQTTASFAETVGAKPAVYTFSNHPAQVLGGDVHLLTDAEERRSLLWMFGAEDVRMERFDHYVAALPPEEFVEHLLTLWDVKGVVVGFNYTFGDRGLGTPGLLISIGRAHGFSVIVVPPVEYEGRPVSSSRIRALIALGDVHGAARLLGRPYALSGSVIANLQNGRDLGFPTANIAYDAALALPANGVYVTEAVSARGAYRAMTNVGNNPTLHGKSLTIETHLLDFSGDLYGTALTVRFLDRIREEIRFGSREALSAQLQKDADTARCYGAK